ncbi:GATA zinc finger domain-containing protein 14-like [Agrilus planipennis]|uniref:GATA zinc finger domain-containing protein 14-like n=1 Tax=Agrilus planipennis TaxID=224129 RepID=A0A1W4XN05_AGRPL|nr:GATA zinc finger domain-containing protein 14-like [Agrilus planipennis]
MKYRFDLILILFTSYLVNVVLALNVTEQAIAIQPTEASKSSKTDKTADDQTDLIKQILSARTTVATTTITIPSATTVQSFSPEKENEAEHIFKRGKENDKMKIEGLSIEEILKKCKEAKEQTTQNFENAENINPDTLSQNNIANYIASLQYGVNMNNGKAQIKYPQNMNHADIQNHFLQNMNAADAQNNFLQNINSVEAQNHFFQNMNSADPQGSFLQQLIGQYYGNKIQKENSNNNNNKYHSTTISQDAQEQVQTFGQQQPTYNTLQNQLKPIQLVPTILQKVILKDGSAVYYWPRKPQSASQTSSNIYQQINSVNNNNGFSQDYQAQASQSLKQSFDTTSNNNPSNKKSQSKIRDLPKNEKKSDILPEYEIKYDSGVATNSKPSTPSNYNQQLKFIVPFRGCKDEVPTRYPNQFDPYAYLAKPMQPSEINLRVPYVPRFHAIKTLTIPDSLANVELSVDEINKQQK